MTVAAKEGQRRNWLERHFGKAKENEVDEKLSDLGKFLDSLGLNRKEQNAFQQALYTKGVLEDAQLKIAADLEQFIEDDAVRMQAAAGAIAHVVGAGLEGMDTGAVEEPAVEEPMEGEEVMEDIMQEDGAADGEEDEEEEFPKELIFTMARETTAAAKAMGQMAPSIVELAQFAKAAAPLIDQAQMVPDLQVRIKELETALQTAKEMTPRVASRDVSTELNRDDPQTKTLADKAKKGTEGTKIVAGIRVKE